MRKIGFSYFLRLLGVALLALVLWAAHRELAGFHFHDLRAYLHSLPTDRVGLALGATVLGYVALISYDLMALLYIGRKLNAARLALVSFISFAFSMNIGFSMLSGGSVRFRLYSEWGLTAAEIAKVIVFCTAASFLGFGLLAGLALTFHPFALPANIAFGYISVRIVGCLLLAFIALALLASALRRRPMNFHSIEFRLPSLGITGATALLGAFDWLMAGSALFALMPAHAELHFTHFIGIFLIAQILGIVSGAPGGVGVFESLIVLLLPASIPKGSVLAALFAFRAIYYLLPLLIAATLMTGNELLLRRQLVSAQAAKAIRFGGALIPRIFSLLVFMAGALLLFSGATPPLHSRLGWIEHILPLPLIELSHFLGSLTGIGLLLLSNGLRRRLDAAWLLTILLLAAGAAFSLLKGADYEEAAILLFMVAALAPCRGHFTRRAALIHQRFTPAWWMAIVLVITATFWLGFFSYKHIDYANDLWWRFSVAADAPRFLRASVGMVLVLAVIAALQLLSPSFPDAAPTREDIETAAEIAKRSDSSNAWLAVLGDKHFLFNAQRTAFIMYATQGRSWVVMGDPIGPRDAWEDLLYRFCEQCEQNGGRTVFYQVDETNLRYYVDLGLMLYKLGEEGRVALSAFTLEGGSRKNLRASQRKLEREGCQFEVLSAGFSADVLNQLHAISNAWLAKKNQHEKGFSLGFFDETYIARCPVAVVRHAGKIVAFANLWGQDSHHELSLDLMRFDPETAPVGVMEYLFIELMLWGKQQGYAYFSLGMTPLAGLESRRLTPLWNRLGAAVFRHGEHFYNFQGLRSYKQKFDPEWEGRYLAIPSSLRLPGVLFDLTQLIGRRMPSG